MDNNALIKMAKETAFNLEEMKLKERRGGYYENSEGKKWIRVTAIVKCLDKPALRQWAANTALDCIHAVYYEKGELQDHDFEIAKSAFWKHSAKGMQIGKDVHKLIERHIQDGLDLAAEIVEAPEEVRKAINAFIDWENRYVDCWLISECRVWSDELNAAGKLDAIAVMKDPNPGLKFIVDFKASSGIYDEAYLQTGAYYRMWEELVGKGLIPEELKVDGVMVLCLDKKSGMPKWKDATPFLPQSVEAFERLAVFFQSKMAFDDAKPDWREQ